MAAFTAATLAASAAATSGTLAELISWCKGAHDTYKANSTPSLTAYTKQTNIMTRLYIEDNILRDDICVPLVGVLNQLYVSYVLSALNIDTLCANGRTVREMMEVVGTESYDLVNEIMNKFGSNNYNYSNEDAVVDLEPATQRLPVGRLIELSMTGAVALSIAERETSTSTKGPSSYLKSINIEGTGDEHNFIPSKNPDFRPSELTTNGSQINTSTASSNKTSISTYQFKAYLYVQLIPYVLKSDVVDGYISANFNPPLKSRWQKLRAGEISFWNDFVFTRDLIKQQEKVLKNDKSGVITEMMIKNRGKLGRWFAGLFNFRPISHNIANSIMICSKETFRRACTDSGIQFDNFTQRQRYFNKTWSMIICVVDPMYNSVEMYFNGIDAKGTYTFDMINKVGAKGKDSFDLKEIMGAFSQGLSPKF